jgi:hypothetical protein
MHIFCLLHSDPKCSSISISTCALYRLIMSVHLPACDSGDYFLVQSNPTITISVFTTPRLERGTNEFLTVNHNILLLSITTLIYNGTNVSPIHNIITKFDCISRGLRISVKSLCHCDHSGHCVWPRTSLCHAQHMINAMEQSPSCEANHFSASQEIPHILWNPKVHYILTYLLHGAESLRS